jgi:hypothetical protein
MKSKRTVLGLQALETRDTPSVSVSVVAGDLYVTGNAANDQVQLSRLANGAVRVQGLNGTSVNGFTYADRFFNDDLFVNLGTGANRLTVLDANGGISADVVDIKTGSGADEIYVHKLTVRDDLLIDTGEGNDYVYLNRVTAAGVANGVGVGTISVNTRGGADTVAIYNSYVSEDVWAILDTPSNSPAGFNDALYMDNVRASDDFWLYGFGGNDRMYLNNLYAGDTLSASMGAGNDFLKLTNSRATTISTHGEAGTDTLQYYNDSYTSWNYTGWESYVNAP